MVFPLEAAMAEAAELELQRELKALDTLLGDTRARFYRRETPRASAEPLIELDREIRGTLLQPHTPELQAEVRRLMARLHALDPAGRR
jgi:hypothetical protein